MGAYAVFDVGVLMMVPATVAFLMGVVILWGLTDGEVAWWVSMSVLFTGVCVAVWRGYIDYRHEFRGPDKASVSVQRMKSFIDDIDSLRDKLLNELGLPERFMFGSDEGDKDEDSIYRWVAGETYTVTWESHHPNLKDIHGVCTAQKVIGTLEMFMRVKGVRCRWNFKVIIKSSGYVIHATMHTPDKSRPTFLTTVTHMIPNNDVENREDPRWWGLHFVQHARDSPHTELFGGMPKPSRTIREELCEIMAADSMFRFPG